MYTIGNAKILDKRSVVLPGQARGGHVSRRFAITRYLLQKHSDELSTVTCRSLAQYIKRYIQDAPLHQRETSRFVREIIRKVQFVHDYNVQVCKFKGKYPRSKYLDQLLVRYVELEMEILYKEEYYNKAYENIVEQRILRLLLNIYCDSIQNTELPPKTITKESGKAVVKLFANVNPEHRAKYKLINQMVEKVLDKIGLLKEVNQLKGKDIPLTLDTRLSCPSVMKLYNDLLTSDYGTDDDSSESDSDVEISNDTVQVAPSKTDDCASPNNNVRCEEAPDSSIKEEVVSIDDDDDQDRVEELCEKKVPLNISKKVVQIEIVDDDDDLEFIMCWGNELSLKREQKLKKSSNCIILSSDSEDNDYQNFYSSKVGINCDSDSGTSLNSTDNKETKCDNFPFSIKQSTSVKTENISSNNSTIFHMSNAHINRDSCNDSDCYIESAQSLNTYKRDLFLNNPSSNTKTVSSAKSALIQQSDQYKEVTSSTQLVTTLPEPSLNNVTPNDKFNLEPSSTCDLDSEISSTSNYVNIEKTFGAENNSNLNEIHTECSNDHKKFTTSMKETTKKLSRVNRDNCIRVTFEGEKFRRIFGVEAELDTSTKSNTEENKDHRTGLHLEADKNSEKTRTTNEKCQAEQSNISGAFKTIASGNEVSTQHITSDNKVTYNAENERTDENELLHVLANVAVNTPKLETTNLPDTSFNNVNTEAVQNSTREKRKKKNIKTSKVDSKYITRNSLQQSNELNQDRSLIEKEIISEVTRSDCKLDLIPEIPANKTCFQNADLLALNEDSNLEEGDLIIDESWVDTQVEVACEGEFCDQETVSDGFNLICTEENSPVCISIADSEHYKEELKILNVFEQKTNNKKRSRVKSVSSQLQTVQKPKARGRPRRTSEKVPTIQKTPPQINKSRLKENRIKFSLEDQDSTFCSSDADISVSPTRRQRRKSSRSSAFSEMLSPELPNFSQYAFSSSLKNLPYFDSSVSDNFTKCKETTQNIGTPKSRRVSSRRQSAKSSSADIESPVLNNVKEVVAPVNENVLPTARFVDSKELSVVEQNSQQFPAFLLFSLECSPNVETESTKDDSFIIDQENGVGKVNNIQPSHSNLQETDILPRATINKLESKSQNAASIDDEFPKSALETDKTIPESISTAVEISKTTDKTDVEHTLEENISSCKIPVVEESLEKVSAMIKNNQVFSENDATTVKKLKTKAQAKYYEQSLEKLNPKTMIYFETIEKESIEYYTTNKEDKIENDKLDIQLSELSVNDSPANVGTVKDLNTSAHSQPIKPEEYIQQCLQTPEINKVGEISFENSVEQQQLVIYYCLINMNNNCGECKDKLGKRGRKVQCAECYLWFHKNCTI